MNPRSAMNKTEQITRFIEEEEIDVALISESHDRENKRLEDHIKLNSHIVISNLYQRSTNEKGGRPAIIANTDKYNVENLTNTTINIPWGVEVTWALLTPKIVTKDSVVKKIMLGAIYVKPGSKKKSATTDHIAEVYNTMRAKYGKGLQWVIAGDTNEMKLGPILRLNENLKSVVKKPTRLNKKNPSKSTTLDNIITDLHKWYPEPKCLPPIDPDRDQDKPSDHLTVIYEPLTVINNISGRKKRDITLRPITESGQNLFGMWIKNQTWKINEETHSVNEKVEFLHNSVMNKISECFPLKTIKVTSDDSPWCNNKVKRLKRLKCREYNNHRSLIKWKDFNDKYKAALIQAKSQYYKNIIKDLKVSNPSQWYSKLKRICSYDQEKHDPLVVAEIELLSDQAQAEKIADHFCNVRQRFDKLDERDINIPIFKEETIPHFSVANVKAKLELINPKKSVPEGDIPPKVIKQYAGELAIPLANIINSSIKQGVWPDSWKQEHVTPVAKVLPPRTFEAYVVSAHSTRYKKNIYQK